MAPPAGFSGSLLVPVTAKNRVNLRRLRELELEAWISAPGASEPHPITSGRCLRAEVSKVCAQGRSESRVYAILAAAAAISLGWGLLDSWRLVENWPGFLRLIHQLLS